MGSISLRSYLVCLLIVRASAQLCLSETNTARKNNGNLPPLVISSQLVAAAKVHNDYMVSHKCFSHQCPGEPGLGQRVSAAGYNWSAIAENLAAGSSNCQGSVNQWLNSDGHKRNLLGSYKHLGCAKAACTCTYSYYWTCVYAKPL